MAARNVWATGPSKSGNKIYGPPYTTAELSDFYSRNSNGPVTIVRAADSRKERKSRAPQHPSPAKPARARN